MINECDWALMVWDGKSIGTFLNMLDLISLGKSFSLFFDSKTQIIRGYDDLETLLPNVEEGVVPFTDITEDEYREVITKFMPSAEMRNYLLKVKLSKKQISELICGSPVPLKLKAEFMKRFSEKEYVLNELLSAYKSGEDEIKSFIENAFAKQYHDMRDALDALQLKPGEVFNVHDLWYDDEIDDISSRESTLYLSLDKLKQHIRKDIEEAEDDYADMSCYDVRKWTPDADDISIEYVYTFLRDEPVWFAKQAPDGLFETSRYLSRADLDLPVPFRVGDIIAIDSRPFLPVKHALILKAGDDCDGCVQSLSKYEDGSWRTGALTRSSMFVFLPGPRISSLYRAETFFGRLPDEEKLLIKAKKYLNGSEEKGSRLWEAISDAQDHPLSENEVLDIICKLKEA